ncbi:hypothetical protein PCK2_000702 [Pneumocystis canis]|nr:hypothetical protein PCK2_000702 [Pneumocystis canis]
MAYNSSQYFMNPGPAPIPPIKKPFYSSPNVSSVRGEDVSRGYKDVKTVLKVGWASVKEDSIKSWIWTKKYLVLREKALYILKNENATSSGIVIPLREITNVSRIGLKEYCFEIVWEPGISTSIPDGNRIYSFCIQGNVQSGTNGKFGKQDQDQEKKKRPKYEPPVMSTRVGRRRNKNKGPDSASKFPTIYPTTRCRLKLLKMERIKDYLLLEQEFVSNQELVKLDSEKKTLKGEEEDDDKLQSLIGSPMGVGTLEEMIDEDHAIVSSATGPEYYVSIMSFVNKDLLELGCSVLLHHKAVSIVGVLTDDVDPMVSVMKLEKAPTESYADIGGLESQIQEIKEAVELPLTHPELYEEIGIKPPKGVILYGDPGTGKTLLAKAVANQTSATFLRIVGSELIQKYLGDGPKFVPQNNSPSIVFIDEIDAIGTKRYDSTSSGEREIQRTMLELLNQLDGFDDRGDVKVIMATNRINDLDPALIRPGRMDRKILFETPDQNTKRKIFQIHTSKMNLGDDVSVEEFITAKDEMSGADVKAICTEAGLMALRERRMRVIAEDFRKAKEQVLKTKQEDIQGELYL